MNFIINPLNNEKYSISSLNGKKLLKMYVNSFNQQNKIGGANRLDDSDPITLVDFKDNADNIVLTNNGHLYIWEGSLKEYIDQLEWFEEVKEPLTKQPVYYIYKVPKEFYDYVNLSQNNRMPKPIDDEYGKKIFIMQHNNKEFKAETVWTVDKWAHEFANKFLNRRRQNRNNYWRNLGWDALMGALAFIGVFGGIELLLQNQTQ